jgi:hypothetical protein
LTCFAKRLKIQPIIDKFCDLKNLKISKQRNIHRNCWKQRAKISITATFEEEILENGEIKGVQNPHNSRTIYKAKVAFKIPISA